MSGKILIFGGTTEGRKLAEFCEKEGIFATVSVTTEYGAKLLGESEYVNVIVGRMDEEQMGKFLEGGNDEEAGEEHRGSGYGLVVDATHPYAVDATRNIRRACERTGVRYVRVVRECVENSFGVYFDGLPELIDYVNRETEGDILVTTGSKELEKLCAIRDYQRRSVIRFLPNEQIVEGCVKLGYRRERMIMEQGPFNVEQNCAHMKSFSVKYLITKDSGTSGGFEDKIEAARQCGVVPLVLRRPVEQGVTLEEIQGMLVEMKGLGMR